MTSTNQLTSASSTTAAVSMLPDETHDCWDMFYMQVGHATLCPTYDLIPRVMSWDMTGNLKKVS
jgi:hypothetical protein